MVELACPTQAHSRRRRQGHLTDLMAKVKVLGESSKSRRTKRSSSSSVGGNLLRKLSSVDAKAPTFGLSKSKASR